MNVTYRHRRAPSAMELRLARLVRRPGNRRRDRVQVDLLRKLGLEMVEVRE